MKKYLFLIAAAITFGFTSCSEDDCDHDLSSEKPSTETKTVVGSWYNEELEEEDRYAGNGTFYARYCNKTRSAEQEGRWEMDSKNSKLTWTYSFMGQMQFADWKVKEFTDYTLNIYSEKNGEHTYGKIVETYQMQVGGTQQIMFAQTTGNTVTSYTSRNPRLASVQNNGLIKAEGEKGTTYIKVKTKENTVWVKVVVGDDCLDLWYDYQSFIGDSMAKVKRVLGVPSFNGDDGYSFSYALPLHDHLTGVNVFLDMQSGSVSEITMLLNSAMPESELLSYLKAHYYAATEIGESYYTTGPDVNNSSAVVYYDQAKRYIHFLETDRYILPDYTSAFGLKDADIVKKYGSPYFGITGYYQLNNYYANLVAFTYHKTTSKVTAYTLIINDGVSADVVKSLLAKKYNLFKEEGGQYGYRDAATKEDARVLVVYTPDKQLLNVYDYRNFQ